MEQMFGKREARHNRRTAQGKRKGQPYSRCTPPRDFKFIDAAGKEKIQKVWYHFTKGWRIGHA